MKILKEILYKVAIEAVNGSTEIPVNKIDFDSRNMVSNDVFVAIKGTVSDGHDFIEKAILFTGISVEPFTASIATLYNISLRIFTIILML